MKKPWVARLLPGGFDGTAYAAGLLISLDDGWKTYWRVPGAGGIAPELTITGPNLASAEVLLPLPSRLSVAGEEVIGYQHEVVFGLRLLPKAAAAPMAATVQAFFGVCDVVCIPAQFDGALAMVPASGSDTEAAHLLATWQARVPVRLKPGEASPVTAARVVEGANGPELQLDLARPLDDVFVEGKAGHYFKAPVFKGSMARLAIAGAKTAGELAGVTLRLTLVTGATGLEQQVTLS